MRPRTFSIQTLGCKVNQYEGEQLAALLRARGLVPAPADRADLRIVHTCSVTVQAASKSRQLTRRAAGGANDSPGADDAPSSASAAPRPTSNNLPVLGGPGGGDTRLPVSAAATRLTNEWPADQPPHVAPTPRVVVTGCWATSDPATARALPGVAAVITHHDDVAAELDRLLESWHAEEADRRDEDTADSSGTGPHAAGDGTALRAAVARSEPPQIDAWDGSAGTQPLGLTHLSKSLRAGGVNDKIGTRSTPAGPDGRPPADPGRPVPRPVGFASLPLLVDAAQPGRRRALLKVQDGCDAHCTYCIIPRLRSAVWSKPVEDAVEEARRLVGHGHVELVLTGIFLGAYGQPTALRRRQPAGRAPLAELVEALCTRVPGLRRVRLSSLEPGDLTPDLLAVLRSHAQVVPHFHLPLQSGSDRLLRRMNRQYTRDDFLRMVEQVRAAFDRPALTTDVIAGFPGEGEAEFAETAAVAEAAGFIHVHAFHFSPRPGTAAARWQRDFVRGPAVNDRIATLRAIADRHSLAFRRSFVGQTVELLIEQEKEGGGGGDHHDGSSDGGDEAGGPRGLRHGRCERYFPVWFEDAAAAVGDFVRVRIEHATPARTHGTRVPIGHV